MRAGDKPGRTLYRYGLVCGCDAGVLLYRICAKRCAHGAGWRSVSRAGQMSGYMAPSACNNHYHTHYARRFPKVKRRSSQAIIFGLFFFSSQNLPRGNAHDLSIGHEGTGAVHRPFPHEAPHPFFLFIFSWFFRRRPTVDDQTLLRTNVRGRWHRRRLQLSDHSGGLSGRFRSGFPQWRPLSSVARRS